MPTLFGTWWGTTLSSSPVPRLVSDAVDDTACIVSSPARAYAVSGPGCAFDDEAAVTPVDVDVIVLPDYPAEHLDAIPVFIGYQIDLGVSEQTLLQASQPLVAVTPRWCQRPRNKEGPNHRMRL